MTLPKQMLYTPDKTGSHRFLLPDSNAGIRKLNRAGRFLPMDIPLFLIVRLSPVPYSRAGILRGLPAFLFSNRFVVRRFSGSS